MLQPLKSLRLTVPEVVSFGKSFNISWSIEHGTNVSYLVILEGHRLDAVGAGQNRSYSLVTPSSYSRDGLHKIGVRATNLVSVLEFGTKVLIQYPVLNTTMTTSFLKENVLFSGCGTNNDYFPLEYELVFQVSTSQGSNLHNNWLIGNSSHFTAFPRMRHAYTYPGCCNATVFVRNNVSQSQATNSLNILRSIHGLRLRSLSTDVKFNRTLHFSLEIEERGTSSSFTIDMKDRTKYRFEEANMTVNENGSLVNFTHVYNDGGWYKIRAVGTNVVSFASANIIIFVIGPVCRKPKVTFQSVSSNSFPPTRVYQSRPFFAKTKVILRCNTSNIANYSWQLSKFNNISGLFDPFALDTRYGGLFRMSMQHLSLRSGELVYGLYELCFTAQMVGANLESYRSVSLAYVEVIPSPLKAVILGGQFAKRGYGQYLKLDGSGSRDLDTKELNNTSKFSG